MVCWLYIYVYIYVYLCSYIHIHTLYNIYPNLLTPPPPSPFITPLGGLRGEAEGGARADQGAVLVGGAARGRGQADGARRGETFGLFGFVWGLGGVGCSLSVYIKMCLCVCLCTITQSHQSTPPPTKSQSQSAGGPGAGAGAGARDIAEGARRRGMCAFEG